MRVRSTSYETQRMELSPEEGPSYYRRYRKNGWGNANLYLSEFLVFSSLSRTQSYVVSFHSRGDVVLLSSFSHRIESKVVM